ncbi:hypothetical protein E2C01_059191 [Portunus trituberculatus]|uniref:Uncharacterized protein n=1 Tax=Portunus trituberculatus TaxID=210409 RepID=A0A5B7H6W8_PORTR|nr:hypothetical protein [Portunus trituberculatus]
MCWAMSAFVLKHLLQLSHLNSLSPVCLKACLLRLEVVRNFLPHSSHS